MVKVIIVYESKYGNTKRVAETIAEGMKEVGGIKTSIIDLRGLTSKKLLTMMLFSLVLLTIWADQQEGLKASLTSLVG